MRDTSDSFIVPFTTDGGRRRAQLRGAYERNNAGALQQTCGYACPLGCAALQVKISMQENETQQSDARRQERFRTDAAVAFPSGIGTARNVSASGIYFETDARLEPGSPLEFSMEFTDLAGTAVRLHCEARIVRVEQKSQKIGVGAQISSFRFERMDERA